jgi:hypothetical protein
MRVMFQPSPMVAEVYQPPSQEHRRLLRSAAWLTSPEGGRSGLPARVALRLVIAPMTQLTFFSFDLQAFLFLVFHRRRLAVLGHALFMTTENLFIMAWLREIDIATTPIGTIDGGLLHALLLFVLYGSVAWRARLPGWFALTVPVLALLYLASGPLEAFCRHGLHVSPAWGILLSASLVALSHGAEHFLPPRTVHPWRWTALRDYLDAPKFGFGAGVRRWLQLVLIFVIGAVGESWASLRLMHYNWLMLMMRMGYAPQRYVELQDWVQRAWATGQPALDFVGSGGGTFLEPLDSQARR